MAGLFASTEKKVSHNFSIFSQRFHPNQVMARWTSSSFSIRLDQLAMEISKGCGHCASRFDFVFILFCVWELKCGNLFLPFQFVKKLRPSEFQLHFGLVNFSSHATVEVHLSGNERDIMQGITSMKFHSGGTNFSKALEAAHQEFSRVRPHREKAERIILFQTDGEDGGDSGSLQRYLHLLKIQMGVKFFVAAVGVQNETYAKELFRVISLLT